MTCTNAAIITVVFIEDKCKNNLVSSPLTSLKEKHKYNTRNGDNLRLPTVRIAVRPRYYEHQADRNKCPYYSVVYFLFAAMEGC